MTNEASPATSHQGRKTAVTAGVAFVGMLVPSIVLGIAGQSGLAGAALLPTVAGMVAAMMGSPRLALAMSPVLAVLAGLTAVSVQSAWLAALVMATASGIMAISCIWGRSTALTTAPIVIAFDIGVPPALSSDTGTSALLLAAVTLGGALWGTLVGFIISRGSTPRPPTTESVGRAVAYAITLALMTGIAAFISVRWDWAHTGAWFMMTVVIILRPYVQDGLSRGVQRALGTIVGFVIAYAIHLLIPWTPVLYVLGAVLMVVALLMVMDPSKPYWLFTALMTPAIVLFEGAGSSVVSTDLARLGATIAGAALALGAELILYPGYRAGAKKRSLDHF